MKRLLCGWVALGVLVGGAGEAEADYVFTTLDAPGSNYTMATGINNAGQIVGKYGDASDDDRGFLLSGGRYARFDVPGGFVATNVTGINDHGLIAGWTIVNSRLDSPSVGFIFDSGVGSFTTFRAFSVGNTFVQGINNSGQIAGFYSPNERAGGPYYGFIRSGSTITTIEVPGSAPGNTEIWAINNAGQLLVSSSRGYALYQPTDGTYTALHLPGPSQLTGLNDAGQIVGYYADASFNRHAFVLSDGVLKALDVPGSDQTLAYGINDAGEIVGEYEAADGTYHGFLATPVPEPATLLLLAIGTLGVIGWAWRRKGRPMVRRPLRCLLALGVFVGGLGRAEADYGAADC